MNDKYIVVTKVNNPKVSKILKTLDIYTIREFIKIDHAYKYWLENTGSYMAKKINGGVVEIE